MYRPLLLLIALNCVAAQAQAADLWEVRRAQVADQTEEWTKLGRVPGWKVEVGEGEAPQISISGDEKGAFRGTVLVGRRYRVPEPPSHGVQVRLQYQTYCKLHEPPRAGYLRLAVFTPQRWNAFASDPALAEKWDLAPQPAQGVLAVVPVHMDTEDVTTWREWDSGVLRSVLQGRAGQEVIVALVWTAMHFEEEWAKIAEVSIQAVGPPPYELDFLRSLQLERPELAGVKLALEAGDLPRAKEALVEHMRRRTRPVPLPLAPDSSPRALQMAQEFLDHTFRLVGCPPTRLKWPFAWNEDPHQYDQWPIALNRHDHWLRLGEVYAATGDERYAREFAAQVKSWCEAMPVYIGRSWIQGPHFEAGKSPLSLDAGIRMALSWWPAYEYFKSSPSFDPETQVRMLASIAEHGAYLADPRAYHPQSNWGAMEVNGLFHVAMMLPEHQQAAQWLELAKQRLVEAYRAQVYPDGVQIELAPGYHGVTLSNFVGVLETARRNEVALPEGFEGWLEQMYDYYLALAMPDGRYPALNDSGWGNARAMLLQGLKLFPGREDWRYVATAGEAGVRPGHDSRQLPHAGWHVMRTGWGQNDTYLLFETGPYGGGHQHEDQLSLILHAGGHTLLTEGGIYSYDSSDWRKYVLSSRAHNVVLVDGQEQNRRTRKETYVQHEPAGSRWFSDDNFDYAQGLYDSGFGAKNEVEVTHRRQVLFVKPHYFIVIETMTPKDQQAHRYEALLHFDTPQAQVQPGKVTATSADGGLQVLPLWQPGLAVKIVQGQKEPVVQGWLPTGRHNELRPIPTAVLQWEQAGQSMLAYLLVPVTGDTGPVAGVRELGPSAAEISLNDGGRDVLVCGPAAGRLEAAGLGPLEGELALLRLDREGHHRGIFLLR